MFYIKDTKKNITAIEAVVSISGRKYKYATGISVDPKFWINSSHRAKYTQKYPDAKEINDKLTELEETILSVVQFYKWKTPPEPAEFREKVKTALTSEGDKLLLVDYLTAFYKLQKFKKNTIIKYQTAIGIFQKYEKEHRQKIYLDEINISFYRKFRRWFYGIIKPDGEPYSKNYFGSIIKVLIRVMNFANENYDCNNTGHKHSEFIVEAETAESIYLSIDELIKINNIQFTDELIREYYKKIRMNNLRQKRKSLEVARCKFLIGAYTALRVSDFKSLEETDFSENYLKITTSKTQKKVVVPLNSVVKYYLTTEFFRCKMSEQKINDHIKEICEMAQIIEPVTLNRTHGNKLIKTTLPKYKFITTHCARRSAATNMYKQGIPAISIMKITGHTTEKSFMKYIKISEEENAELLSKHPFFQ